MYGIFVQGRRPMSKKEVKEFVANNGSVELENTSMFGGYSGTLDEAPNGTYTFVGPDPYTSRKFYGNIIKSQSGIKVT